MNAEGPALEILLHRLAETPEDFLGEPSIGKSGKIHVAAVAADLCRALGCPLGADGLAAFAATGKDAEREANFLRVVLVTAWLLYDPWFRATRPPRELIWNVLAVGTRELAEQTPSAKFPTDPDRREEMARFALARLGYRPRGESLAQAQDRLTSLSAVERARVLQASKDAEERARAVREALVKKAAEESADKYSRE
jgi:hypothetical protein